MSYSWSGKWPTLTELFFGKGNGPQGPLNGKTIKAPKKKAAPSKSKEVTAKKPAPKEAARGTRKDFGLQKKLKEQLNK